MRSNFGWQSVLTRSLSVSAVLAWTTAAAWGQASDPNKPTSEPSSAGNISRTADPVANSGQNTRATETNATNPKEATGIGTVMGAHFDHGMRGAHTELKITTIDPNSPANQAGLQPNDRLIAVDGRTFANPRQLIAYLSVLGGRPVPVVFERNGREMTVQLFPGQFQGDRAWLGVLLEENNNDQPQTFQNRNGQNPSGQNPSAQTPPGSNQNPQQPSSAHSPNASAVAGKNAAEEGAEISQVYPNGPAARAGLRSGDVIIQVNGQKVDDPAELVALVHEMKPQSQAELEVMRDNKQIKVPVTLGSRNQEYMAQFGPGQGGQGQFGPQQFGPGQYGPGPWQGNGQFAPGQNPGQFPQGQGPGQWQGQAGFNANDLNQQLTQQNQRIEDELKQLREEIKQLREQLQKK
jgi:PDZ domain-containing secreted protein